MSGSNAGYNMFRGSVKGTGYPLHSPVSPSNTLPCVNVCHHVSTGIYYYYEEVGRQSRKFIALTFRSSARSSLWYSYAGKKVKCWDVKLAAWWKVDCWVYAAEGSSWAFGLILELRGQHYDEILITFGRAAFWRKFWTSSCGELHKKHAVQHACWAPTQNLIQNPGKLGKSSYIWPVAEYTRRMLT